MSITTRKGFLLEREEEWVVRDKAHLLLLIQTFRTKTRTKYLRFTVDSISKYPGSLCVYGRWGLDCSGDEYLMHRNDSWKKDKWTGCGSGFYTTPEFKLMVIKEAEFLFGPDCEAGFGSDITTHRFHFSISLSSSKSSPEAEDPHDPSVLNLNAPTKSQQQQARRSRRW